MKIFTLSSPNSPSLYTPASPPKPNSPASPPPFYAPSADKSLLQSLQTRLQSLSPSRLPADSPDSASKRIYLKSVEETKTVAFLRLESPENLDGCCRANRKLDSPILPAMIKLCHNSCG